MVASVGAQYIAPEQQECNSMNDRMLCQIAPVVADEYIAPLQQFAILAYSPCICAHSQLIEPNRFYTTEENRGRTP